MSSGYLLIPLPATPNSLAVFVPTTIRNHFGLQKELRDFAYQLTKRAS